MPLLYTHTLQTAPHWNIRIEEHHLKTLVQYVKRALEIKHGTSVGEIEVDKFLLTTPLRQEIHNAHVDALH